ncbi:MAG: hypothetical protein ACD_40C00140G0001 [uncultured bacterium]|nr:MAG: hypothetical protein ACD_40C00140G0001 [uncultured bacterium]
MRVTVLAENLNRAIGIVGRSVASKPQIPILGSILFRAVKDGLELTSTDLEMSFRVKEGAKVGEEGEVCLPAKVIGELAATIASGTVEIVVEKEVVSIRAGKVKAQISVVAGGEFPTVPVFKGKADLVFDSDGLVGSVSRVAQSAAKDDTRPVFTGILWVFEGKKVKLVATDGYRLGIEELEVERMGESELKKLVIPARSLMELVRVVDKEGREKVEVKIDEGKQQVLFRVGGVELVSRLLAGEFPPYGQILPSGHKTRVEFDREELLEGIKRAAIFARESANIVRLEMNDKGARVSANSSQVGSSETEVEAKVEGEDLIVAFNSRYLLDYLMGADADVIELKSEGSLKPGVFIEMGKKKSNFLQVIMPVRVQG